MATVLDPSRPEGRHLPLCLPGVLAPAWASSLFDDPRAQEGARR